MNTSAILCVYCVAFFLFLIEPFGIVVAQEPLPSGSGPTNITGSNNTQNQSSAPNMNTPNNALPNSPLSPLFK